MAVGEREGELCDALVPELIVTQKQNLECRCLGTDGIGKVLGAFVGDGVGAKLYTKQAGEGLNAPAEVFQTLILDVIPAQVEPRQPRMHLKQGGQGSNPGGGKW
eukprot:CAMPEP_0173410850 /NCGR_PEP_ID=MMETSP1356-20130122/75548_1 /TAXON_ID=77927 ORGANISM="Hemiselmis virescens, Strain PCC157" /NCGR_SAMPLE_ID=MMETSP1356 /ASSEMBLY_ACC=CAM_ASM_000847 /LENGTH=103 /DNA_ID=CAMNT_0014372515 /DNA_START=156 /DNA_END=464 /DNA_ORIENTATION=+